MLERLIYGSYTVQEAADTRYAQMVSSGSAVLSIDNKESTVTLVNQEKRDGSIRIKKVLFNPDETLHSAAARKISLVLSSDKLEESLNTIVKTGGLPSDLNDPDLPAGPRDGVGLASFGEAGDALHYGSYNLSEFMPRYLGTEFENNYGFEAYVRPGIVPESEETWASATGEGHFKLSGNSFNISLDVNSPKREFTIYNKMIYPKESEFAATKVWIGGKAHTGHDIDPGLLKLYRSVS